MSDYIKGPEVQKILGCSNTTLWRWRKRGYGPPAHLMPNGRYLYKASEIHEWVETFREGDAA